MVKLFGWETEIEHAIDNKRENELEHAWRRRLLGLANSVLRWVNWFLRLDCLSY